MGWTDDEQPKTDMSAGMHTYLFKLKYTWSGHVRTYKYIHTHTQNKAAFAPTLYTIYGYHTHRVGYFQYGSLIKYAMCSIDY